MTLETANNASTELCDYSFAYNVTADPKIRDFYLVAKYSQKLVDAFNVFYMNC